MLQPRSSDTVLSKEVEVRILYVRRGAKIVFLTLPYIKLNLYNLVLGVVVRRIAVLRIIRLLMAFVPIQTIHFWIF